MSNDFDTANDDNQYFDATKNYFNKGISSAGIQTAREFGIFNNERLYSNMLSMVNKQKEQPTSHFQFHHDSNQENDKLMKKTHSKYNKFVTFIKQRHFKTYSSKTRKYGFASQDYNCQKINERPFIHNKNQLTNLFLTQEIRKKETQNNKILLIYKKIFDRGLDEAKVYSNIKLVPLIDKNTNQIRPSSEIEVKKVIEMNTAINFNRYIGPKEDQNSKLMKKRGFLNFHTNPSMKKGLHLLYSKYPSTPLPREENLQISNEKIENNLNNNNLAKDSKVEAEPIKVNKKLEISKGKIRNFSNRNCGLREKLNSCETKNKSKIFESKSDPIDDKWLIKVVSSKYSRENSSIRFNKNDYKFERVSSSIIRSNSKRQTVEKGVSTDFRMIVQNYHENRLRNMNIKGSEDTTSEILTNSKGFKLKSKLDFTKSEVSSVPFSAKIKKCNTQSSTRKISTSSSKHHIVHGKTVKKPINGVLVKDEIDAFFK